MAFELVVLAGEEHFSFGLADVVVRVGSIASRSSRSEFRILFGKLEEHARIGDRRLELFLP